MYSDEPLETRQFEDVVLKVYISEIDANPREWDHLGTMFCGHRRYSLGDDIPLHGGFFSAYDDWDDVRELYIEKEYDVAVILPLYLYDHSGLTMSIGNWHYPFNCSWDAGQVGWIFATKDSIRECYGMQRVSRKAIARAKQTLRHEVEEYDSYLRGECYAGVVTRTEACDACGNSEEVVLDSIGGILGDYDEAVEYMIGDCFAHILQEAHV